ncbi:ATP-binding cassette sub-family G member 1-like isoform X2 [Dinothrombium tinctorium]|uniref:ATP-binding cassette sub-family G member 1-like isoform X2 n=1 Tax=Dinothrombium tinctorium TaxID=1965070 RepID=A0A3S3PWW2_9ACAR|nr:ATP-binding cassette sub-family G member 1-like isoform X2 [Dinothrombium tinctorium]
MESVVITEKIKVGFCRKRSALNGEDELETSKMLSSSDSKLNIALRWKNISYVVTERSALSNFVLLKNRSAINKCKVILNAQSGFVASGQMMAIIGESGSGKTTLIEIIAGRRKNANGQFWIEHQCDFESKLDEKRVKIAFLPQNDYLHSMLTVSESIHFASRLKNFSLCPDAHRKICIRLLHELNLNSCKDVRLANCSGGQRKRVSLSMELVNRPNILIVDEPTSGLDSSSAYQCIQLLKKLSTSATNPLITITTIHQASAKILGEFQKLYILSHSGKCIYNGDVNELLPFFANFNLHCPQFHNPADFAIEVASGEYGEKKLDEMAKFCLDQASAESEAIKKLQISSIIDSMSRGGCARLFQQTYLLTKRTLITTSRDPILNCLRLFLHVAVALIIGILYKSEIGKENACFRSEESMLSNATLHAFHEKQSTAFQNISFLFFTVMFLIFASTMPTVMVFPLEMTAFMKEKTNGWYSCLSYYLAKSFSDVPFQVTFTFVYVALTYFMTGQIVSAPRFALFTSICIIESLIGQTLGTIVGAIFSNSVTVAAFMAPISVLPFVLISGFFVKITSIPYYLKPLTYLSYMRYTFEAMILTLYGDRCEEVKNEIQLYPHSSEASNLMFRLQRLISNLTNEEFFVNFLQSQNINISEVSSLKFAHQSISNNSIDESDSFVLKEFNLNSSQLSFNFIMLVLLLIAFRAFNYFILLTKTKI